MKYNENMTASEMSATGGFVQNSGGPNLIITSFEKSGNTLTIQNFPDLLLSHKTWFFGLGQRQSAMPSVQTLGGFRCQVSGVSKNQSSVQNPCLG